MKKRTVLRLSAAVFALLAVCTAVSAAVWDALLPRVTALTPESGEIGGEVYRMVVSSDCVYQDGEGAYVFCLKETDGGWKAERRTVTVEAADGGKTAIRRAVAGEIQIAADPTAELQDGGAVKLRG